MSLIINYKIKFIVTPQYFFQSEHFNKKILTEELRKKSVVDVRLIYISLFSFRVLPSLTESGFLFIFFLIFFWL